jgi:hypothetical protein
MWARRFLPAVVAGVAAVALLVSGCASPSHGSSWSGGAASPEATSSAAASAYPGVEASPESGGTPDASPTAEATKVIVEIRDQVVPQRTSTGFRADVGYPRDEWGAKEYAKELINKSARPFWVSYFDARQPQLHEALLEQRYVYGGTSYPSKCLPSDQVVTSLSARAFYCAQDGVPAVLGYLYLPSGSYWKIWESMQADDANVIGALLASNLYSYYTVQVFATQLKLPGLSDGQTKVMAACLTGIWTRASYPGSEATPARTNAAIKLFESNVGLPVEGEPDDGLLKGAFDDGFINGSVARCGNNYWPGSQWK